MIFGLWAETWVYGEYSHVHGENMQIPFRKAGKQTSNILAEVKGLTTDSTLQNN